MKILEKNSVKYKVEYQQSKVSKEDLSEAVDKLAEILYEQINNQINKKILQDYLNGLKERHSVIKNNLTTAQLSSIESNIKSLYNDNCYFLTEGEIDDYFSEARMETNFAIEIKKQIIEGSKEIPQELKDIIKIIIND